jgi:hypothetical protein
VAMMGSATGQGFLCCGLAPCDVNQPRKSHHLREGPAPVPHLVQEPSIWMAAGTQGADDDVMNMPRAGGFNTSPKGPRRQDHGFAPATPRAMVVEPSHCCGRWTAVSNASCGRRRWDLLLLDDRDTDVRDLAMLTEEEIEP